MNMPQFLNSSIIPLLFECLSGVPNSIFHEVDGTDYNTNSLAFQGGSKIDTPVPMSQLIARNLAIQKNIHKSQVSLVQDAAIQWEEKTSLSSS